MAGTLKKGVASLCAAGALTGAVLVGSAGTAMASPASPSVAPAAAALAPAHPGPCRRFWHNGGWDWRNGHWDNHHRWINHRERYWRARWFGC